MKEVIDSLQFEKYNILSTFFNKKPFLSILFREKLKCSDHLRNVTTKFWRVLQAIELFNEKDRDCDFQEFFLEIYINSCLSCIDATGMTLSHFLKTPIKIHEDRFIKEIEILINKYSVPIELANNLRKGHQWVKDSLYPYRNIVHHMGGISPWVGRKNSTNTEMKLRVVEKEIEFNKHINDLIPSDKKNFILTYVLETNRWIFIYLDQINKTIKPIPNNAIIEKLLFSASELIKNHKNQKDCINQLQDIVSKLHELFDLHFILFEPLLLYILDPEKNDLNALRKLMKTGNYASPSIYQIESNSIKLPNLLTGCEGDAHKYYPVTEFFNHWKDTLYYFLETYFSLIVHIQSDCFYLEEPNYSPAEVKIKNINSSS